MVLFTCTTPDEVLEVRPHDLYFDEISIIPSYSCGPEDTRRALEHLAAGDIEVGEVVTHRFPLDRITDAYEMAGARDLALKTVVEFP